MLAGPQVNKAVVASPAITEDDVVQVDLLAYGLDQRGLLGIGDDLRGDMAVVFEDPEDNRLAPGTPASFTLDSAGAEAGRVDIDFTSVKGSLLAMRGDPASQFQGDILSSPRRKAGNGAA